MNVSPFFYYFALVQCCNLEFFLALQLRAIIASSFRLFLSKFANKFPKIKCFYCADIIIRLVIDLVFIFLRLASKCVCWNFWLKTRLKYTRARTLHAWYNGTKSWRPLNHHHTTPNSQWPKLSIGITSKHSIYINFYSTFQQLMPQLNKDNWLEPIE